MYMYVHVSYMYMGGVSDKLHVCHNVYSLASLKQLSMDSRLVWHHRDILSGLHVHGIIGLTALHSHQCVSKFM